MTSRLTIAAAVAAALVALPLHAAQPLLARSSDPLAPRVESAPLQADGIERAPVSFARALDPAATLTAPAPFVATSRSYWEMVDAATLQRGLGPAADRTGCGDPRSARRQCARALAPQQWQVRDPAGTLAVDKVVDDQQLRAAGMAVGQGSAMVRTGRSAAVGTYRLQSAQCAGPLRGAGAGAQQHGGIAAAGQPPAGAGRWQRGAERAVGG
ncbi:DUF4785 domain-containing protein [Stenotrophomonas rhizophila]